MSSVRPGRRPGNPDTRAQIVAAARAEFAGRGFDRTSMRGVARAAGVDARLVHHYFDSKEALLLESLGSRVDPRTLIAAAADGPAAGRAERVVRAFLGAWEQREVREPFLTVLRAAATNDAGARLLREGLLRVVFSAVRPYLHGPDVELRLDLIGSQVLGLAFLRYVAQVEPLASASVDELAPRLAAALEAYFD